MSAIFKPKRGTKASLTINNQVLSDGEMAFELHKNGEGKGRCNIKIGDGISTYNNLPYALTQRPNLHSTFMSGGSAAKDVLFIKITMLVSADFEFVVPYKAYFFDGKAFGGQVGGYIPYVTYTGSLYVKYNSNTDVLEHESILETANHGGGFNMCNSYYGMGDCLESWSGLDSNGLYNIGLISNIGDYICGHVEFPSEITQILDLDEGLKIRCYDPPVTFNYSDYALFNRSYTTDINKKFGGGSDIFISNDRNFTFYSGMINSDNIVSAHFANYNSKISGPGTSQVALGYGSTVTGNCAYSEGMYTYSSSIASHAEGYSTTASGQYSHTEGQETYCSSTAAHAEGYAATAGYYSHAEGRGTKADYESHAEGRGTRAISDYCHAEGLQTTAINTAAHAEGYQTYASGPYAHASGQSTTASNSNSFSGGHYNVAMAKGGSGANTTGTAFVIGNGTSKSYLSNAFSVQFSGIVKAKSTITGSTTADYAEFFEWEDGNPDKEDRVGKFVTTVGNKIKFVENENDYILGIVSGEPFVLGNGDCDTWNGMYLKDEFNRTILEPAPLVKFNEETGTEEEVFNDDGTPVYCGTRPKLNPNYDHTQPYISRFDRKEWAPVGMLGILSVYDDGTCQVNGFCKCNSNAIATRSDTGYRVIERVSDNIIKVIFR